VTFCVITSCRLHQKEAEMDELRAQISGILYIHICILICICVCACTCVCVYMCAYIHISIWM